MAKAESSLDVQALIIRVKRVFADCSDKDKLAIANAVYPLIKDVLTLKYRKHRKSACELCGSFNNLGVHHIDENRANNDTKNLQTLCQSCHAKVHRQLGTYRNFKGRAAGFRQSEETKLKISLKHRGVNNPSFGKSPSDATRAKIRISMSKLKWWKRLDGSSYRSSEPESSDDVNESPHKGYSWFTDADGSHYMANAPRSSSDKRGRI